MRNPQLSGLASKHTPRARPVRAAARPELKARAPMHAPGVSDNAALKTTSPPDLGFAILDQTFFAALQRLRDLRNFLYQEAVPVAPAGAAALEMGNLSALYLHPNGRTPTVQEWNQVERQTQAIFLSLTPPL